MLRLGNFLQREAHVRENSFPDHMGTRLPLLVCFLRTGSRPQVRLQLLEPNENLRMDTLLGRRWPRTASTSIRAFRIRCALAVCFRGRRLCRSVDKAE